MSIQYSGSAQTSTFAPSTKQNVIDSVETALLAAGWTTISGHLTTNLLMQSATTPQGYAIRVRLKDNAGTCVTFSLENATSSLAGGNSTTVGGAFVNPGTGLTFRVVCNAYQCFIWTTPSTTARAVAAFGVPWVPSFLTGVTTQLGWMQGNAAFDTDTSVRTNWQTALQLCSFNGAGAYASQQCMYNSTLWSINSTGIGNQFGSLALFSMNTYFFNGSSIMTTKWQDTSAFLIDALVSWGDAGGGTVAQTKGQLWDAVVSSDAYAMNITTTFDSHNWITLTDTNNGGGLNTSRGTLLLATS